MDNPGPKEEPKEPESHKDLVTDESSKGPKRRREENDVSTHNPDQKRYKVTDTATTEILEVESDDSTETVLDKQTEAPPTHPEFLEPIYVLRAQLESALAKLPKPLPQQQEGWGRLVPQTPTLPVVPMFGSVFTIGRSSRCNLSIRDSLIPSILCKIFFLQGQSIVECSSSSGALLLNQRVLRRESKLQLRYLNF